MSQGPFPFDKAAPGSAVLDARKIASGSVRPDAVELVTYSVLPSPAKDRRANPRQRTRLRSGKIADGEGRFVTECLIHDLSSNGARLRHPTRTVLPARIYVYDDQSSALRYALVLWRKGHETGVRFSPDFPTAQTRALAAKLQRRFYALTQ